MYNGLFQVYCIKPEEKTISLERVKSTVAQLVEYQTCDQEAVGSNPSARGGLVSLDNPENCSLGITIDWD